MPLHKTLKMVSFDWSPATETTFEKLKIAMTKALGLALPGFANPFFVDCDASGVGIGAMLHHERPIAFLSQAL